MQHIPEDQLHAYLDQALGRLSCVEIESHLAECTRCRAARDEIAALRDRTTALLAKLAPRHTSVPPLALIRREADRRLRRRQRLIQRSAWAASVLVAVAIGWGASLVIHPRGERVGAAAGPAPRAEPGRPAPAPGAGGAPAPAPAVATTPASRAAPASAPTSGPAASPSEARTARASTPAERRAVAPMRDRSSSLAQAVGRSAPRRARAAERTDKAPTGELATVGSIPTDAQLELGGVWRTVSWDGAREEAGDAPPRIDGLPVVEVQVQRGDSGKKPLMVVAQQLASGQVIRMIEGPAPDVSALLGRQPTAEPDSLAPAPERRPAPPAPWGSAFAFRRGDRMLAVTGSLPRDSLRAMVRRLNLMGGR